MYLVRSILAVLLITLGAVSCVRRQAVTEFHQSASSPSPTPSISLPKPAGYINDYANVFSAAEEKRLDSLVTDLRRDVDVEFGIVTIDTTNGVPLFDYSLALAREWKPGGKSGRGLLLVLAIKDQQWRLQVSKALETDLPDDVCKELGERSVGLYKKGKYALGAEQYVQALGDRLKRIRSNQAPAQKVQRSL